MQDSARPKTTFPAPAWDIEVKRRYNTGARHAFILHFNVGDEIIPGMTLEQYIPQTINRLDPAVIVFYDRAHGLSFAFESMRQTFIELTELNAAAPNPLAQMAGLAPQQGELPTSPSEVLPLLDKLLHVRSERPMVVVINWAETILPNAPFTQLSPEDRTNVVLAADWGNDRTIAALGNVLILTTRNLGDLHQQVASPSAGYHQILVDLPDGERRQAYIDIVAAKSGDNDPDFAFKWGMSPADVARLTTTLNLRDLKTLFLEARYAGELTADLLNETKAKIISAEYGDLVQIVDPSMTFADIGDLEHIKQWLRRSVIDPLRSGNRQRCPMGILFTGPPGTGKTAMAEATAGEAGVIMLNIQMNKVFGRYVGDSERNMARMLQMARSAAPCILWLDEIDQGISRGEGDSGASNRVFQQLLQFMSDKNNRGRIVVMAATNRPDLMDAALKRAGRFDNKIPFLLPTAPGRAAIFNVMARRYGLQVTVDETSAIIEATNGWTGAEIETCVIKAWQLTQDEALAPETALTAAASRLRPTTADIESMTALALAECNDDDLLPPGFQRPTKAQIDESIKLLPKRSERQM